MKLSVVENSVPFSTTIDKHENHSEAINSTVDKSSLKEAEERKRKESSTIVFLKKLSLIE